MWAMWDPSKSLPDVPLAVVNHDEGADNNGEFRVVGDEVVKGLLETDYLNFNEVSDEEAQVGLTKGDYLFVVTIPEDFSERTVSLISDNPRQSEVMVQYNDYGGTNGKVITSSLIPQLQAQVASTISQNYATETLTGLNSLGDGIKRAAAGAGQIDDGLIRLQEGAGRAVDGINQVDDGASQLDDGATQLNDGATQLDAGATELNSGAGELNNGAVRLEDGAYQLKDGLLTLKDGTTQLGDGAAQIDDGVQQLTGTLIPVLEQAQGAVSQITPVIGTLRSLGLNDQANQIESAIGRIDPNNPQNAVNELNRLRDGTAELRYNLTSPDAPYISGVNQLVDGSQQLADGTTELRAGTERLMDGTVRLKDGTTQLADGGVQLTDGVNQLKAGSSELKTKLDEGVAKAPTVSQLERSAQQMAVPIIFDEANLHPTQELVDPANPTVKSVESGFSIIIMLVFGYLVMAVLSALLPHVVGRRSESRTGAGPVLRAFALIFGINLLVMGMFTALSVVLGWRPDNWLAMGGVIALIAASGAAMFQLFRIIFGRLVGGLFSVGFFALGLFVFGGVWPLPTVPAPLQFLHVLHPMSHARYAFIRATDGLYDGRFWVGLIVLLAVTAVSLIISILIYNARRNGAAHELGEDQLETANTRRIGEEPLAPVIR